MSTTDSGTSPALAPLLARLSRLNPYVALRRTRGDEPGWFTLGELCAEGGTALADLLARVARHHRSHSRRFVAMTAFSAICWPVAVLQAGAYLAERRVLLFDIERTAAQIAPGGWVTQLAPHIPGVAVLPDDPAAAAPMAAVAADRPALRKQLLAPFVEELGPRLVAALRGLSPLGPRALWGALSDRLVEAVLWAGKALGIPAQAAEEATLLAATPPLTGQSGVLWAAAGQRREPFLRRAVCCLAYQAGANGYCATCPILPPAERLARLEGHLRGAAAT